MIEDSLKKICWGCDMNALMTENDCLQEELELAQRTNFALADEINSLKKQLNDSLKHNHELGEELARKTCDFNEQLITLHLQHHPMLTAEEIAEDLELVLFISVLGGAI